MKILLSILYRSTRNEKAKVNSLCCQSEMELSLSQKACSFTHSPVTLNKNHDINKNHPNEYPLAVLPSIFMLLWLRN